LVSGRLTNKEFFANSAAWQEYRLLVLAVLIGLLGGLSAQVFVWLLALAERMLIVGLAGYIAPEPGASTLAPRLGPYGLWLVPVVTTLGGLLSGIIVYSFAPEAEGHGTDAAVHAFHHKGGRVRRIVPLVKAIASAITIGSGGAAGREGPAAQISVGASSIVADLLSLDDDDRRILVLAGMAAGLSAIFRSPLGMAIFAVEILYSGMVFETEALIYTVVSAVVAYAVNGLFVGWSPVFHFSETLHFTQPLDLVGYTVLGIVAGVVGGIEPTIFYGIRDFFKGLKVPNHIKPAIGGLLMGLLALVVPQTISTGYGWVQQAITGGYAGWSLILLAFAKILAMSLTISSGGSGGVFGPNVYIGAMVGAWTAFALDHLFALHLSIAAFAVVGMAAVFAGTARVPIATLVMVAEMTGGYGLIVPSMLATSIAFVVQRTVGARFRYPRLYEAQVELLKDSPTHHKNLLQVAFELLKKETRIDASELSLPQLADLLRLGQTLSIHNGQVELFATDISRRSKLAGQTVAEAFGKFPNLILVAVIRDNQVLVPRGATVLSLGDRLLIAADATAKNQWTAQMAHA
jgi:CIC family chloride channel protein